MVLVFRSSIILLGHEVQTRTLMQKGYLRARWKTYRTFPGIFRPECRTSLPGYRIPSSCFCLSERSNAKAKEYVRRSCQRRGHRYGRRR